ncbi:hypothetical protein CHS0354_023556 [Potamilus streckersoni]|uniref:Uncharacterized protein n=1 Tax=Potamilus streckersoni TaxID=2493646 RepID=A0AAE0VRA6_9BIVA|nr:hypothetical protein CHS0354_023556 [Potamilus streckersoni]
MSERPINCTIKQPVLLTITDTKSEFHSGCRVLDISLSNVVNPERKEENVDQVGEIQFKNYYVAYLTVKAKFKSGPDTKEGENKWRTCVKRMRLMPNAHAETGSQDYFCVSRKHMAFELVNISALRLILQQPSPVWKDFKIEELRFFKCSETSKPCLLPSWLTEVTNNSGKKKIEGISNLELLSATLQQLWALSEEVAANQTNVVLGRYEGPRIAK